MTVFADPPITPKAVATRERLLEMATDAFVDRGYAAVSLRDIALTAEVTKGAIYGHFRSKGQLLVEVIRRLQADLDTNIAFDEDYDLFLRPESVRLRLLLVDAAAAARHDDDVAAGITELYAERNQWILDAVGDSYSDPATAFFIITAVSHGIGMEEAFGHQTPAPERFTSTFRAMLGAVTKPQR